MLQFKTLLLNVLLTISICCQFYYDTTYKSDNSLVYYLQKSYPAAHYEAFLRYLQSTQPTTATSSSAISVPSSIALSVPSTSGIIVTSSAATSVPQPPQQSTQPSAELTYGAYRRYRDQHPGPMSNRSFLRWIFLRRRNGGGLVVNGGIHYY
ncbi:uncharacterized protein LOC105845582 isoform X2 [Hydra vulgaris]|uniref:uncharacterized protein LOC105845582 isoform X2 n=1 Tax=Hydra vulgaris TaxID=6087 RepID=UPI001F5E9CA2|nr:uncharacterized protein LOC105845582 isoform X2 [Hydra vulgaris]